MHKIIPRPYVLTILVLFLFMTRYFFVDCTRNYIRLLIKILVSNNSTFLKLLIFTLTVTKINECDIVDGICQNGKCMDVDNGFRCMCNSGYKLSMDGKTCKGKILSSYMQYSVKEIDNKLSN